MYLVLYSVQCIQMGTFYCGDVVLDSLNKASRDVDNILDQINKSKYVRNIITMMLILHKIQFKKKTLNVCEFGSKLTMTIWILFITKCNIYNERKKYCWMDPQQDQRGSGSDDFDPKRSRIRIRIENIWDPYTVIRTQSLGYNRITEKWLKNQKARIFIQIRITLSGSLHHVKTSLQICITEGRVYCWYSSS